MKKKYLFFTIAALAIASVFFLVQQEDTSLEEETTVATTRAVHKDFIKNSPFKQRLLLTKKERKATGIPPNKYLEREWELTMNPTLGRPTPENLLRIQKNLKDARALGRTPGDAVDNMWVERGPNNVGGRTRAIMFDPNDATNNTAFAGGVSGGLWKNTDISNSNSTWTKVDLPENVNVSTIAFDPNTITTFYLGTGESYTSGDASGNGVWKSTDSGATWTQIFGGISGPTVFVAASAISVNTPAGIAGDYPCFPSTAFGSAITVAITADFILADDGIAPNTDGCTASTVDMTGKIAVIRRGACTFVSKVKAAQDAGAIGAIVMNNINGTPVAMGGTDATITIPSVMVSNTVGDTLEAQLLLGTVNGTLNPPTGDYTGNLVPGIQHINDLVIKDNGGTSEIYVAAADGFYSPANATTYVGGPEFGLYKSSDNGTTWSELMTTNLTAAGKKHCPNDIEIDAAGTIWLATKNSILYGDGGGEIFSSVDNGVTFVNKHTVDDGTNVANRVQIAASKINADYVYILAQGSDAAIPIVMQKTTNGFVGFSAFSPMALPNDADTGIPANDFTRGQAFYDLVIAVNPTNDQLYVGGIDLFKSTDSGSSWGRFSHWYGGGDQEVHADQHAIAFGNGDANKMLFGNDGGVYYSGNNGTTTTSTNTGYNTSQFYSVGVAPSATGDNFAGGLQDNGTQQFFNATAGINNSFESQGGDGAATDYSQVDGDYYISNYVYNDNIVKRSLDGTLQRTLNSASNSPGDFINQQTLDSNLNLLYTNYTDSSDPNAAPIYQIRRYTLSNPYQKTALSDPLLTSGGTPIAFKVSPFTTGSTKLYVGTVFSDLLLVDGADGTPTWSSVGGSNFVGSISDIEFGATENDMFVTMHNYGINNIWYSPDGGTTWSEKDGNLPDMPVKCILQNPLNLEEVIVGTELGVWYTANFSDPSPTWASSFNGMSNVKVTDLDVRDDNKVYAATYGRGVFSGDFTAPALSVNNNEFDSLTVYPNPTADVVTIKSNNNLSNSAVTIHDITGRLIANLSNTQINNNQIRVDLSTLSKGSYFITIENDTYKSTKQVIKK